jgi:hypothetical protein
MKQFSHLYQSTVKLDNTLADAILDVGSFATMRKKPRNTTPVPRPNNFADVFHMDNIFGPEVSIGNIHYGLLFTDRFIRMTYLYPLQNLTSDITKNSWRLSLLILVLFLNISFLILTSS